MWVGRRSPAGRGLYAQRPPRGEPEPGRAAHGEGSTQEEGTDARSRGVGGPANEGAAGGKTHPAEEPGHRLHTACSTGTSFGSHRRSPCAASVTGQRATMARRLSVGGGHGVRVARHGGAGQRDPSEAVLGEPVGYPTNASYHLEGAASRCWRRNAEKVRRVGCSLTGARSG